MSYKSYPTYNDIDNGALRTWNRCQQAFNINADKGPEEAEAYIEQFSQKDKNVMYTMLRYIQTKGYENVKREIIKGLHPNTGDQ